MIVLSFQGYWEGYDPKTDPSALEEFITSAFRFGHSLLPQRIERWSHRHTFVGKFQHYYLSDGTTNDNVVGLFGQTGLFLQIHGHCILYYDNRTMFTGQDM